MKTILVLAAFVAVAVAVHPSQHQQEVVLLKETQHDNLGLPQEYQYSYEQSDGQKKHEQAHFEQAQNEEGKPVPALVLQGSFSYTATDGQQYTVHYTADKDGFHPEGAHLPVAPQ